MSRRRSQTLGKAREVFSEREVHRSNDIRVIAQWREFSEFVGEAHCDRCDVLLLVPYDVKRERYVFANRAHAHEISCDA